MALRARNAAGSRNISLVAENEAQDVRHLLPPEKGGFGLDAMWIDDFHHAARVAVTGVAEAFWSDFRGTAQELVDCALHNALYQGQWSNWQKRPRGTRLLNTPADQLVFFLQNHDQVAYHLKGQRLHQIGGDALARALTVYLLLLPQTPLLFMGQEFFSSSPFFYFTDHAPELQAMVRKGREEFLRRSPSVDRAILKEGFHPPMGEDAFQQSKLKLSERVTHQGAWTLHQVLLRLRRDDAVFSLPVALHLAGEALSEKSLVLRFTGRRADEERVVLLNLGDEVVLEPCPYPLLAPGTGRSWTLMLSSEESRFGGGGTTFSLNEQPWTLPSRCALVLASTA
jgi:maltooligosyltrehalose trehalohydrolase